MLSKEVGKISKLFLLRSYNFHVQSVVQEMRLLHTHVNVLCFL